MYDYYLTKNGNILNAYMGCFQTVDGHYLRPVLEDELYHLVDVLIPVKFPENLEQPDISCLEEFALNKGEFEPIFRWMHKTDIYDSLVDSDLIFFKSNHNDLGDFLRTSNPKDFVIGIDGNIYINLKGCFFYLSGGHLYTLHDPFMNFQNIALMNPKVKETRRSKSFRKA